MTAKNKSSYCTLLFLRICSTILAIATLISFSLLNQRYHQCKVERNTFAFIMGLSAVISCVFTLKQLLQKDKCHVLPQETTWHGVQGGLLMITSLTYMLALINTFDSNISYFLEIKQQQQLLSPIIGILYGVVCLCTGLHIIALGKPMVPPYSQDKNGNGGKYVKLDGDLDTV